MENSVSQALPKESGWNVDGLVPAIERGISPKVAADSESAVFMATNPQKAVETSLSSTSPFPPWVGLGNDFRHISVIALLGPGLPWGFTLATRDTPSTRATFGQGQRGRAWRFRNIWGFLLLSFVGIGMGHVT
jgi:hypothetical protein